MCISSLFIVIRKIAIAAFCCTILNLIGGVSVFSFTSVISRILLMVHSLLTDPSVSKRVVQVVYLSCRAVK